MKDELFDISFRKLAVWYLPTFLRTRIMKAFIIMLIYPMELLYIEFMKVRKRNLIKMNHNYQKFSMEKRLNDAFDTVSRRIKIVKAVQYEGVFIYTEGEIDPSSPGYFSGNINNKMKWVNGDDKPIYLRMESELTSEFDFIVEIPNTNIDQAQLRAEINFYVLQSKNYDIKII
ncbi:hypothetical protein GCM10023210_31400 [Chryseobacterium ginsengisoli]|uniref:Uncharacterized protein n=1 Tax=Chryseobacterium ginsengisoli TaxID=363853 RepID=A0ABP9MJ53_9FLAO